jgi:hypothetical protein
MSDPCKETVHYQLKETGRRNATQFFRWEKRRAGGQSQQRRAVNTKLSRVMIAKWQSLFERRWQIDVSSVAEPAFSDINGTEFTDNVPARSG